MDPDADRVVESVGDRRRDIGDTGLSHSLGSERSVGIGLLDQDHLDLRHIQGRQHLVGGEAVGEDLPGLLVDGQVLGQCIAQSLIGSTLEARFDREGVDRLADVVGHHVLENLDDAGLDVDFDLGETRLEVGA